MSSIVSHQMVLVLLLSHLTTKGTDMIPFDGETRDQQAETEAEVAAIFDGTVTLIASIRCYGSGSGKQRQRCLHHLNLYPASPQEALTLTQAKAFARARGWQCKQRDGHQVWLCPGCS